VTSGARRTVTLVVAALVLLVGGVAWISDAALGYARKEGEGRARAAVEENVRLALWRMDSFVVPILARAQLAVPGRAEQLPFVREVSGQRPPGGIEDALEKQRHVDQAPVEPARAKGGDYQRHRSSVEQMARAKNVVEQVKSSAALAPRPVPAGVLRPVWFGGELALVRNDGAFLMVWLDWRALQAALEREIQDLLPRAKLAPAIGADERRLASLPIRLDPGPTPLVDGDSPVLLGLGVAWVSVLLAVAAVVALLLGALALSERRAVFVSAVTHELRTPLTTFRTYTEMLARGMVPEGARAEYLETLWREADRLSHLTENVLLYARLERGRGGDRVEDVSLAELVERMRPRLEGRASQAGMTLAIAVPDASVRGDATAIEQILFNLVDNACKYAAAAEDKQIRLTARTTGATAIVEVSDRGPGIPAPDRRRLFQPFSRSAREAAGRAPGVGLGLALSRRLARAMGGELTLLDSAEGACFRLTLPGGRAGRTAVSVCR
jgi:signal transduction histidine kinase